MIRAVLFDMNGVIINDEPVHEAAFKKILSPFDIQLTHDDYQECCAGQTDHRGFQRIQEKFKKSLPIEQLSAQKDAAYFELVEGHVRAYEGVIELIKTLSTQYSLALVSSSSRVMVDFVLNYFHIAPYFKIIVSADNVKRGKPDPEPYLMASSQLHIPPTQCVVIEDSKSGVLSAKSAGCKCIATLTTRKRDAVATADAIIEHFDEVPALIKTF